MIRTDRFKKDDVIVKVRDSESAWPPMGTTVTVFKCDGDGLPWIYAPASNKSGVDGNDCVDDDDFELAAVVNSPLYKALL